MQGTDQWLDTTESSRPIGSKYLVVGGWGIYETACDNSQSGKQQCVPNFRKVGNSKVQDVTSFLKDLPTSFMNSKVILVFPR